MTDQEKEKQPFRVAVIADAHLHDIDSDYDFTGISINGDTLTLRSWADTRRSSRVFNESKAAFEFALHDLASKGIKLVVLLGDYSDDGQIESTYRVRKLLSAYEEKYGLRFFAITGNHDAYALHGKQQSTRFVLNHEETVLVTSDPDVAASEPDAAILTEKMFCEGVAASASKMSRFGLCKQSGYLHWESPFGLDDSWAARVYRAQSSDGKNIHMLVDASYLVEPLNGLWLCMIDANAFEPRNGVSNEQKKTAFIDCSNSGWNAVLTQRPHLLLWLSDITRRARASEKTLLVFSHYPTVDPFNDIDKQAFSLFGNYDMHKRKPASNVAKALIRAGINTHFGGHLHANTNTLFCDGNKTLTDYSVPSLVAFPACYTLINANAQRYDASIESIGEMTLDPRLIDYYQKEQTQTDETDATALSASNYGEFHFRRMYLRVIHHYLKKDWPEDIANAVEKTTLKELVSLLSVTDMKEHHITRLDELENRHRSHKAASILDAHSISDDMLASCSMTSLVADWYCLRHGGVDAIEYIKPDHMRMYCVLCEAFSTTQSEDTSTHHGFFSLFLSMLTQTLHNVDLLPRIIPID